MSDKRNWMLTTATAMVATGNNFDIDERTAALSALYDAIVAATPEPTDEGWIEHRGEKPYPEGKVDVEYRTGVRVQGADADDYDWTHDEDLGDFVITRWRPARD